MKSKGKRLEAHEQDRFLLADQKTQPNSTGNNHIIEIDPVYPLIKSLSYDQIKTVTTNETPFNNNRSFEPIRFVSGESPGTFDTIRLTSEGLSHRDIQCMDQWTISGVKVSELDSRIPPVNMVLYLDSSCQEVSFGDHVTTLGMKYLPKRYGKTGNDLFIIDIPSPSALMGQPDKPLLSDSIPSFINQVKTIVNRHVQCDVGTFSVSRLDTSTIFQMSEPVSAYIGLFNAITNQKKGHSEKKVYGDESIQFFNKSGSVGFYDKGAQQHAINTEGLNLLRYEIQSKRRESVKNVYGGIQFNDLQKEEIIVKGIKERAKAFNKFFPFEDNESCRNYINNYNLFKTMKDQSKRNHVANFMKVLALKEGLISIDQLDLFMRLEGYTPQYIARHTKALRAMQSKWIDTKDLYNHVYQLIQNDIKAVA